MHTAPANAHEPAAPPSGASPIGPSTPFIPFTSAWTLPGSRLRLRWCEVPRSAIDGVDDDVRSLLEEVFPQLGDPIDLDQWSPQALAWLYLRCALVLKAGRGQKLRILGTGVPLLVWDHVNAALAVDAKKATVAAWVIESPQRLSLAHKYTIVAAEVMGLCALYGSHRRQLRGLYTLLKRIKARLPKQSVVLRVANGKTFADAMGCSTAYTADSASPGDEPTRSHDPA